MGLFSRLSQSVRSTLDAVVSGAEDPDAAADYDYERMKNQLQDLEAALTDLATERKRLEARRTDLDERIDRYERRSREAMADGEESVARTALEAKKEAVAERRRLDDRIDGLQATESDLREKREDLQRRVERFRTEKESLKARRSAGMEPGGRADEIDRAIDRATDDVEGAQARSAALDELESREGGEGPLGEDDDVARELDAVETESAVERELETIREELGVDSGDDGSDGERTGSGDAGAEDEDAGSSAGNDDPRDDDVDT